MRRGGEGNGGAGGWSPGVGEALRRTVSVVGTGRGRGAGGLACCSTACATCLRVGAWGRQQQRTAGRRSALASPPAVATAAERARRIPIPRDASRRSNPPATKPYHRRAAAAVGWNAESTDTWVRGPRGQRCQRARGWRGGNNLLRAAWRGVAWRGVPARFDPPLAPKSKVGSG
jgi:hypothetical protein